jgi:hypothetical protein
MTRIMFYLCFGAATKTFERWVINLLPMDPYTRIVFAVLESLILLAFCIEVINLIYESLFDEPFLPRHKRTRSVKPRLLSNNVNLQKLFGKAKLLLRGRNRD